MYKYVKKGCYSLIKVNNLKKSYGGFKALHGISFTVERGHVYGFLGPNGAGKSTTMNIITGCLAASEGTVSINGHDIFKEPIEAKKCIGYLPEQPPVYLDMKVTEYLDFVGRAKGLRGSELYSQIDEVIELTDLSNVHDRLIKNLSKGYRQRVGIAQAMLGNPEVIILDEPTVGLDPIQIIEIRELIKSLAVTHTVILSSHILQEISAVCDRIMIIANGRLVANDTIDGLMKTYGSKATLEVLCRCSKERAKNTLSAVEGILSVDVCDTEDAGICSVKLEYAKDRDIREDVWKVLAASGITVLGIIPRLMTLEDIFISLTDKDDEDEEYAPVTVQGPESPEDPGNDGGDGDGDDDDDDGDGGEEYKPLFS